jgi:pimeloyl-ACP methyl ester carboxylesterase
VCGTKKRSIPGGIIIAPLSHNTVTGLSFPVVKSIHMFSFLKKWVQFSTPVILVLAGCNNNSSNDENSKTDTMNTTTIKKEEVLTKTIRGSAGVIYVDDGGEGGIPVLFIHSFGGDTRHWANQLSHLRTSRRAIAMDIRGHGRSAAPAGNDYTIESLANDVAAVVDSLGLTRVVLVGHSMGGSSAIAYAARYSGRVAGMVLTGTPAKTPPEQSKAVIASLESEKYDTVMADYMNKLLANAKPETDRLEREGMNKLSKETNISIITSIFSYDPVPPLGSYKGPVLIISGSVEDQAHSLHKAFPKIGYKTIGGTSHWMQLDKPEEFNKLLDEFLSTIKE